MKMVKIQFVGDARKNVTKYRSRDGEDTVKCDLDSPDTCTFYVTAKKAIQLMNDHSTWFRMPDRVDTDKALEEQMEEEKTDSRVIPLEEAMKLSRTKKISYMKGALGLKVTDKMKVDELNVILESYYEEEEIKI